MQSCASDTVQDDGDHDLCIMYCNLKADGRLELTIPYPTKMIGTASRHERPTARMELATSHVAGLRENKDERKPTMLGSGYTYLNASLNQYVK